MKILLNKLLLVAVMFFGWSTASNAQDNNMLAKIAYESAEEAFAAGNISETYKELNKVDSLLKKITPKSMYLRVQMYNLAVNQNPDNVANAILICNEYLSLSKSFNLPEDKMMEVTKLRIKLEKQKAEWEQKNKEDEKVAARVQSFVDSLYKLCHYQIGMKETDFIKANPELVKQMKIKKEILGTWYQNYNDREGFDGPISILFKDGVVSLYSYRYKTSGKKNTNEIENEFRYKLKPLLESVFPTELFVDNSSDYVKIQFVLGTISHSLTFGLGNFRKAKTIEFTIKTYPRD